MTIIYEVTLHIDRAIADPYDAWLRQHVDEMTALPGFLEAEISTIEEGNLQAHEVGRVVHYRLENREALDAYLRDHAERMRGEGLQRFANRFRATRRILNST